MKLADITRLLHTRAFGVGIGLLALVVAILYYYSGLAVPVTVDKGMALPSPNLWFGTGAPDFYTGLACSVGAIFIMMLLNRVYNVLRSMTWLYIALFGAMQLATPDLMTQFYSGTLLCVVVPLCMLLLLSCYRTPGATRHVFLIFAILSGLCATQYCFAVYIPVFIIGLVQMQVFNGRSVVAALLGLITPWWILFGFGIVNPADIKPPQMTSIFTQIDLDDTALLLITAGITFAAMLTCYILNFLRTIAYNARSRAINGAFTVTALVTAAAMCIDYRNFISYVPMLNFSAAMEITHFFSTHRAEKSFIGIVILIAAYAALFVCQTAT